MAKKAKKKTSRTRNTAKAPAATSLPQAANVPEGFKQLGGGYADSWNPEIGDTLIATVVGEIKTVTLKIGRKTTDRRCVEVAENDGGKRYTIWESATLVTLFDELGGDAAGREIFLSFDGLGKKKAGQNPPKLFTVALAA